MTDVRKLTWTTDFKSNGAKKITETNKKFDNLKNTMGAVGKSMTAKVTAPIVAGGIASIKTVKDFDDGMSHVKALTGATGEDFDKLRKKAIQLGNDTAFSAMNASEGMQILSASGMEVNDILKTSEDMFTLMSAGSIDADTSASVLTNTMAQFNLTADDSKRIIDGFAQGAASAKLGVDDLEYIMGQAGGTLSSMNMSMEESIAMAGQLANAGTPIGQVGTILNAMGREIKGNSDEFKKLGINVYDSSGKLKTMGTVMGELEEKLKGKTDAQRDEALSTVFSGQAMKGAIDWLSLGGEKYANLTKEIKGSSDAADNMAKEMEDNIGGAFRSLGSSLGTLAIEIGDVLKEPIKEMAGFIQELADRFNALDQPTKEMIVKFGLIAGAMGPVLWMGSKLIGGLIGIPDKLSKVGGSFMKLINSITPTKLVMAGIIVAGVALYKNWDKVKEKAGELKQKWDELRGAMSKKIQGKVEALTNKFHSGINKVKESWRKLKEFLKRPITGTVNLIRRGKDKVKNKISGSHRTGKGRVPYNGYIAELHKDEIVLNAETAEKYRKLGGDKDKLPDVTSNIPTSTNSKYNDFKFNPTININVDGNADETTVNNISRETQRVVKQELNKAFKKLLIQGV